MPTLFRTYQFRLYLSRTHVRTLTRQLFLCRQLYNAALEQRRSAYSKQKKTLRAYSQSSELPALKESSPEFKGVGSQVLQQVLRQLDKAYAAFFRRVKAGETPGFPRFKGRDRFNSLTFVQKGFGFDGKKLRLTKVGTVTVKAYRKLPAGSKIKQAIVTRKADGWYVSLQCEMPMPNPLPKTNRVVGIDVGIKALVTTSDGIVLGDLAPLRKKEKKVRFAQRRVSRRKKGSNRRRKAVGILRRRHLELQRFRKAQLDKISKHLVHENDVIFVENLQVQRMQKHKKGDKRKSLRREISNAAWGLLSRMLSYKAEDAGRTYREVNPRNTSQECSACGKIVPKTLQVRTHRCVCGLVMDRDHNAALVIKQRGLRLLRGEGLKLGPSVKREDLMKPMVLA